MRDTRYLGPGRALCGRQLTITGVVPERGVLDGLQVAGGRNEVVAGDGDTAPVAVELLGHWALTGEICVRKCLAGGMRSGRGLTHKACANLCLLGEVPPGFVSTQPVDGKEFLLVGSQNAKMLPPQLCDSFGNCVTAADAVERRGDILVF